jgi:hypothetical protein
MFESITNFVETIIAYKDVLIVLPSAIALPILLWRRRPLASLIAAVIVAAALLG